MVDGSSSDAHASEAAQSISIGHEGPSKLPLQTQNCSHLPSNTQIEANKSDGVAQGGALARTNNTGSTRGFVTPQTQLEPSSLGDRLPAGRPEGLPAGRSQTDQLGQVYNHDHGQLRYRRWLREGFHGPWIPGTRRNRGAIRKAIRNIQRHFP